MIHLDANFLIGAVNQQSAAASILRNWLRRGESFAASSIAWSEFLRGPLNGAHLQQVTRLIQGRIIPFDRSGAEISAQLFNQIGRRRGSIPDCFIAAAAIGARSPLATLNQKDFAPFVAMGLHLA